MPPKAAGGTQWKPKGEAKDADGSEKSSLLMEKNTGPIYDKLELLRAYQAAVEAAEGPQAEALELDLGLKEREEGEMPTGGKTPGARRAIREAKKAEKAARRAGSLEDLGEGEAVPAPQEPATPGGTPLALSAMTASGGAEQAVTEAQQAQQAAAQAAAAQMNAAMMQYLNSMAYAAPMSFTGPPGYTTVMLRNIPNRYSRDMLIERLDETYKGHYDFVYLPIDFNSKCNVGYAFVNFRTPPMAQMFISEFHGKRTKNVLPGFGSSKVCEVSYARVQGRDANMENLRDEKFIEKLSERPEWQPLFFDDDGKDMPFSKTLGAGRRKGRGGGAAPISDYMRAPAGPTGYMPGYPPFGYMPGYMPFGMSRAAMAQMAKAAMPAVPPEPTKTLAEVLPGATAETMLMLKEVPMSLTKQGLIQCLNKKGYLSTYDFLYLPKDTKGEGNRGFAFVNFRTQEKAELFAKEFGNAKVSEAFDVEADAEAVCEVVNARLRSLEGSIARAQSSMMKAAAGGSTADKAAWSPALFTNEGLSKAFPRIAAPPPGPKPAAEPKEKDERGAEGEAEGEKGAEKKREERKEKKPKEPKAQPPRSEEAKGNKLPKPQKPPAVNHMLAPGVLGYVPNYGPYGYNNAAMARAYAAHAMAMQHSMITQAAAQAAAAQHGGQSARGAGSQAKPLNQQQKTNLRKQLEFYFSTDNLNRDMYLRQHIDATTGFCAIHTMAAFDQVRKYRATPAEILECISESEKLETDSSKRRVRLRDEVERKRWVEVSLPAPS